MSLKSSNTEVFINVTQIQDQIAALLYMTGLVADHENISKISFDTAKIIKGTNGQDLIKVAYSTQKPRMMEVIKHRGDG